MIKFSGAAPFHFQEFSGRDRREET